MFEVEAICRLTPAEYWGIFNLSFPPGLLLYSYIPATLFLILLWRLFLRKGTDMDKSWLFFSVMVFLYFVNDALQWVLVKNLWIYVSWHLSFFFEFSIYASILLALYTYRNQTPVVSPFVKRLFLGVLIVGAGIAVSGFNIVSYNFTSCEAVEGVARYVLYALEAAVFGLLIKNVIQEIQSIRGSMARGAEKNIHPLLFNLSFLVFFVPFVSFGFIQDLSKSYELGIYNGFGIVLFLLFNLLAMIRFRLYDTRITAAHGPIFLQSMIIFALFFVTDSVAFQLVIKLFTITMFFVMAYFAFHAIYAEQESKKEIQEKNKELVELNAIKTEFLAFASHQLKAPLTSIKWGIGALRDTQLRPEQDSLATQVLQIANQMVRTVTDFLNSTKLESGELSIATEVTELSVVLQKSINEFRPIAQTKRIALCADFPMEQVRAHIDETKIEQVISNLIDNAIKYTHSGVVAVKLIALGSRARIEVSDTGAGMKSGEAEQLFQKYHRGSAAVRNTGGSGIGLYLGKEIIEMHGGTIGAYSAGIGKGSTFWFELPLDKRSS
jgi:signal transduction histidine kinase